MKRLMLIVLPLLILGGAAFGLMQAGILKTSLFGKKPPKKPATTISANTVLPATALQETGPDRPPAYPAPGETGAATGPASRASFPDEASRPGIPAALPISTEEQEKRLARLTAIYEQMPTDQAGRIMAKLPEPLIERILDRMDERQAGKLLLAFSPERAARLTIALARYKERLTP